MTWTHCAVQAAMGSAGVAGDAGRAWVEAARRLHLDLHSADPRGLAGETKRQHAAEVAAAGASVPGGGLGVRSGGWQASEPRISFTSLAGLSGVWLTREGFTTGEPGHGPQPDGPSWNQKAGAETTCVAGTRPHAAATRTSTLAVQGCAYA